MQRDHPQQADAPTRRHIAPLDGLRAVAVLAVVCYHSGFSWAKGGFIGVDLFFVLSGFLITSLLINEFGTNQRIDLRAFWVRRGRRLLPALAVMLCFVLFFVRFAAGTDLYPGLRGNVLASLFYVANWHAVTASGSYFARGDLPSPLLHTWSLAIEEHFYVIWPLIVLVVLRLTRSLRVLLTVSLIGAGASALEMAVMAGTSSVSRLYYGTDTRAQALLIGSAAAVAVALRPRLSSAWGRIGVVVTGFVSIALLVDATSTLDGNATGTYRGELTLVSVAAAALIVLVTMLPRTGPARLLAVRPLRWTGTISYGIYLWHWPLIVFLTGNRTGLQGLPLFVLRLVDTVALAAASYYGIERPVRTGSWRRWRIRFVLPAGAASLAVAALAASNTGTAVAGELAATSARVPSEAAPTRPGTVRLMFVGDSMAETLANGLVLDAARYHAAIDNLGDPNCSLAEGVFQVENYPPRTSAGPCQPGHRLRATSTSGPTRWRASAPRCRSSWPASTS